MELAASTVFYQRLTRAPVSVIPTEPGRLSKVRVFEWFNPFDGACLVELRGRWKGVGVWMPEVGDRYCNVRYWWKRSVGDPAGSVRLDEMRRIETHRMRPWPQPVVRPRRESRHMTTDTGASITKVVKRVEPEETVSVAMGVSVEIDRSEPSHGQIAPTMKHWHGVELHVAAYML